jgi:hypothetical protein
MYDHDERNGNMSLDRTVRKLEERFNMSHNEEVEETGRTVASLQD